MCELWKAVGREWSLSFSGFSELGREGVDCDVDKTWKILEEAIHKIQNHNASKLSFEELYR